MEKPPLPAGKAAREKRENPSSPPLFLLLFLSPAFAQRAVSRYLPAEIGVGKTLIFIPSKCVISPARLETPVIPRFPRSRHHPLSPSSLCRPRVPSRSRARTRTRAHVLRPPLPLPRGAPVHARGGGINSLAQISTLPLPRCRPSFSKRPLRHPPARHLYCLPLV